MKIYKPLNKNSTDENEDFLSNLIDNKLTITNKYTNLITSFDYIKINPGSDLKIIEYLITKLDGEIRFSRIGDNNERFDAFIEFNEYYCVVEIEIPSISILDAPRNLLDDYAVCYSRNNIKDKPIIPLVICWDLPNKRSDYWNVIKDIKEILEIEIKTISVPAIALHYRYSVPLNLNNNYYMDSDNLMMESAYKLMENSKIPFDLTLGYLQPFK